MVGMAWQNARHILQNWEPVRIFAGILPMPCFPHSFGDQSRGKRHASASSCILTHNYKLAYIQKYFKTLNNCACFHFYIPGKHPCTTNVTANEHYPDHLLSASTTLSTFKLHKIYLTTSPNSPTLPKIVVKKYLWLSTPNCFMSV